MNVVKSLKMHHILLGAVVFFLLLAMILSFTKNILRSMHEFKSHYMEEDIKERLENLSAERMIHYKLDFINHSFAENLGPIYLAIFKEEKELELWLPNQEQKATFPIKSLSPGDGIKYRFEETIFPEGIYDIKSVGLNDKTGYFVQIEYPSESLFEDQKIFAEQFAKDEILISEKPNFRSFLLLEPEAMEDLSYILFKFGYKNVEVLVFPKRPPFTLDLKSSQVVAKMYKKLTKLYDQYKGVLHEPK